MSKIQLWLHKLFFNRWLFVLVIDILFLTISFYAIWGWLTVADVKNYARSRNLDENKIMAEVFCLNCSSDYLPKDEEIKSALIINNRFFPARRFTKEEIIYDKNGSLRKRIKYSSTISYLYLFLILSPGVSNLFFCFGIGYLISIVLVLSRIIKNHNTISTVYLIFRPILGGFASCILLIVVLSGGNLLWENPSNFKGLSLGALATIGALYCENIRNFLEKMIKNSCGSNPRK